MVRYTQHSQQPDMGRRAPYYVPTHKTGNLFQKIKGFFNTPDAGKASATAAPASATAAGTPAPAKPFDNVNVSAIDLSLHSNLSYTSRNPNDTLSEFFNRKGDTPLNDIEIEGVLSLIRKSQTSRAPSRNNSTILSHHHSMFLNSNMDSKLAGLSSFNDANNTTILRPASNNMKAPVRINTPTYVPRQPSRKQASSTADTSVNKSYNTSRSFANNSGAIRKRRIVDYASLQSPYKVKTSSSLASFLEKKKKLEKQANEEKQRSLQTSVPSTKSSITYSGGIIDLSHLDDDEESDAPKEHLKASKPQKLSKTASKLLDILNFDDAKKTSSVKEEKKRASSISKPVSTIITISDESSEDINAKPIDKPAIKPLFEKTAKTPETPAKPSPAFSFKTQIAPAKLSKTAEPVKEDKPPQFSFKDLVTPKNDKKEELKKSVPAFSFGSAKETPSNGSKPPAFNFGTPLTFPSTEPKIDNDTTSEKAHPLPPSNKPEFPANSPENVEIIDSFEFPDVDGSVETTPVATASNGKATNGIHEITTNFNDKPNNNDRTEPKFEFPTIKSISPQTLELVEEQSSDLYKDVFRF